MGDSNNNNNYNNSNREDSNNLNKQFQNKVYNNSNSKEFILKGSNNKDNDSQGDFNNHRHLHHHHLKDQRYFSEFPWMVKIMDRLTWSYSMKLFPAQQETFTASPLVRTSKDLPTHSPFSTESFRNSCSRVEILKISTELEDSLSMAENSMTRTS